MTREFTRLIGLAPPRSRAEEKKTMRVKKSTPVLFVEEIEPCMKFWTERLGFEKTAEVPDGDRLAFVILQKGSVEVMYETFAGAEKDFPALAEAARKGPTFLYVEVEKLEPFIKALRGARIVLPERMTFYGAREIGVTDPAGHHIIFAEMAAAPQQ